MDSNHYFHLFANGDDAKSFISSEEDYVFQFNLVGVCAFLSGIQLKKEYKISRRQLATLCRLPKSEIEKYLW